MDNQKRLSTSSSLGHIAPKVSARNSMDLIEGTTHQFPKPNRKPETNATVQRQRWDAFFEPQYSFGAFIHGLNQEEEQHQRQQHQRKIDQLVDDGNENLDQSMKSPKMMIERASCDFNETEASSAIMSPTLPNLTEKKPSWGPKDEKTLIERLELLKRMRAQPSSNDISPMENEKSKRLHGDASHTARWKRHMSAKAKQLCKEAKQSDDASSTTSSLDPDEKPPTEVEEDPSAQKYSCRRSFLCFLFGFIFPPLWLFGAFYISSHANKQTSACRRIDHIWRRRSRIAFGIFTVFLMIILVIVFVLKPETVGWRLSKSG